MMEREDLLELIEALREEAIENDDPDALAEAELFAVLALAWLDQTERAREMVVEAAEAPEEERVEAIDAALGAVLGVGLVATVAAGVWRVLRASYGDAALTAGDGLPGEPTLTPSASVLWRFGPVDERAVASLNESALFYVREHYSDTLSDRVRALANQALEEGLSRDAAGELFARELGPVYGQSMNYWRLHASAVTVRAREWGRVAGYERAGLDEVYWSSVQDKRTSEQCDFMHGRPIDVGSLIATRDASIAAETPEAQKAAAPWLSEAQVRERVEANGGRIPEGMAPPIHGFCRSRTSPVQPADVPASIRALYRTPLRATA